MIIARHRHTGDIAVEAFEYGIPVPLTRSAEGTWSVGAISIDGLAEDYEDLSDVPAEAERLLGSAREVWARFRPAFEGLDLDSLKISEVRQRLRAVLGRAEIAEADIGLSEPEAERKRAWLLARRSAQVGRASPINLSAAAARSQTRQGRLDS